MYLEAEMTLGSTNAVIGGSDELSTDLLVSVLDASGSPVSGATITIAEPASVNDWDLSNVVVKVNQVA
jgi:hypothetical protein